MITPMQNAPRPHLPQRNECCLVKIYRTWKEKRHKANEAKLVHRWQVAYIVHVRGASLLLEKKVE